MAFPSKLPTWAIDVLQAAPPNNPTKVEPPQGLKDEGWIPDLRPPGEFHNWWMNLVGKWIAAIGSLSVVNLVPTHPDVFTGQLAAAQDMFFDGFWWYACRPTGGTGGTHRSEDAGLLAPWKAPAAAAGTSSQECVASDGAGVTTSTVVTGGSGGELVRSTDAGDNWAIAEAAGSITANNFVMGIWSAANSLFVFITNNAEIWTSATGANGTWTQRTTPATITSCSQARITIIASGVNAGRIVAPCDRGTMYSDDGITWTLGQISTWSAGTSDNGSVVGWTDGDSGYLLAGNVEGDVWRSADSASWSSVATDVGASLPDGATLDNFNLAMQSDNGGVWVAGMVLGGTDPPQTYIYSLDGGVTWTQAPYRDLDMNCIGYGQGRWAFSTVESAPLNGMTYLTQTAG